MTEATAVAPREDENVSFKLWIAAATLASLKHTVLNPEPSDLQIDDILIGCGKLPWNSISADEKAQDTEEEDEEADSNLEEEVNKLIDDWSDGGPGLEEQSGIIFHSYNLFHVVNFSADILLPTMTESPVWQKVTLSLGKFPIDSDSEPRPEIFKIPIEVSSTLHSPPSPLE